jgi:hypothetical protein
VSEIRLESGDKVGGYWSPAGDLIVLAEHYQLTGSVVRHEMLHAIVQRTGHSRDFFLNRCAGTVVCGPRCESDAGPPPLPPASARRTNPGQLILGLEVSPSAPSPNEEAGFFSITVTARNPSADSVLIEVPFGSPSHAFSLQFSGAGAGFFSQKVGYMERYLFAPGETKREVHDFRIGQPNATGGAYPPGQYNLRGGYGNVWTDARPLILAP